MRSVTVLTALFAAGALAQPLELKRDVVVETQINVVYTTVVVTANGPAPAPATAAAPAPAVSVEAGATKHNHKDHDEHHRHHPEEAPAPAPAPIHHAAAAPAPAPEASKPAAPAPAASAAPAPEAQTADSYIGVGVQQHNLHRQNHSAPAVSWDDDLANSAAALAAGCIFQHDVSLGPASNYGQNIASSSPATGSKADELKEVITNMWYNGEVNYFNGLYGQESPDMTNFDSWGHFSQIVWKGSNKIGCATQSCPGSLGYFTVCNYGPAGNMMGEFAQNVLPSVGDATIEG